MAKPLIYKVKDFKVTENQPGDKIACVIDSFDGEVHANLFFEPGNVHIRGLVGDTGLFEMAFPFANPKNDPRPLPSPRRLVEAIIQKLGRGEYQA